MPEGSDREYALHRNVSFASGRFTGFDGGLAPDTSSAKRLGLQTELATPRRVFPAGLAWTAWAEDFLPSVRDVAGAAGLALAYYTGAELAFIVGTLSNLFAPLWPPNMILLCALLMVPYRVWWFYVAAALPAHIIAESAGGMPASQWAGAFLCNVSLAAGVALGMRLFVGRPPWLGGLASAVKYIVLAAIVGPAAVAAGIVGTAAISKGDVVTSPFALHWFLANVMGALTLGAFLLAWIADGIGWIWEISARRCLEAVLVASAVAAGAYVSFAFCTEQSHIPAVAAIVIPPILWASVQFRMRGASGALCITTVIAIAGAIRGRGPFVVQDPDATIISLQAFFAVMAAPFLIVAAVINDQRRSHLAVRQTEKTLQAILDNSPACISVRDLEGRYLFANCKAQSRLPQDYIGKNTRELYPEAVAAAFLGDDAEAIASGEPLTKEERIEFDDGPRTYSSTKFALRDAANAAYAVCTIAADISAIKRSTEALEASETKFRIMAETVPAILFTADYEGRWDYANQRFYDFAGISSHRQHVSISAGLIHPDDVRRIASAWQHCTRTGETFEQELRIRSAAGTYHWFVARCRPIRGPSGRIDRWFGAAVDIDGLKRAENELRAANAMQSAILTSISGHYYTLDERLHVSSMNTNAEKAAGMAVSQAIGRHLLDVYPQVRGSGLVRACRRAMTRREPVRIEIEHDGQTHSLFDVNIYPLTTGGVSVFSRDISNQKTTERMLHDLSNRLLRSQDEERRRIARELHDGTAQNITAVKLNLQNMMGLRTSIDKDERALVEEALSLIDQSLSEIRTLSYWLHPPLLDEVGLAPALRWYVGGFIKRGKIDIELRFPDDVERLNTDMEMSLFRVVQECLGNVINHSHATRVTIRMLRPPKKLVLIVSDNGRGMKVPLFGYPGEDLNELGVGIAGMSARLKQLGGRLDIRSSHRGTTVRAVVPAEDRASGLFAEASCAE